MSSQYLSVTTLSVKNAYEGNFVIHGDLSANNGYFDKNVYILGNVDISKNTNIRNSLSVGANVDISNNLSIIGNTFQYNRLYLVGNNGQGINPISKQGNMYFLGDVSGVGMNKQNPQATLDICGSTNAVFNVFSNTAMNRNIVARNQKNYGITLTTDLSLCSIDFFHADKRIQSGNGGGRIVYDPCGNITLETSNNVNILSNLSVSKRSDNYNQHVNQETVVIYDQSSNIFLPNVYKNPLNSGNSVSLVASDQTATTFLNITNQQKGWKWGAGTFPGDISRNMATTGWTDGNGVYVPIETIVSGNSLVKTRSTLGINTYSPETEKYIIDINGPIHVHHNEIKQVKIANFAIYSMSFSRDNQNGVAVGSSLDIGIPSSNNNNYHYSVLYTKNGGKSWNNSNIDNTINQLFTFNTRFNTFFLDVSNVVLSGGSGFNFQSSDGGITWRFINLTITNNNIASSYIAPKRNNNPNDGSNHRLFLSYPFYTSNFINKSAGIAYFDVNASNNYINATSYSNSAFNIYSSHGYNNVLFVAGNGISTYDISSVSIINTTGIKDASYNAIYTYDGSFAIAVGNNIISYTKNAGSTWIDNNSVVINARDVFIQDLSNAIVVGDNSTIIYTRNGGIQWTPLLLSDINAMGNGNRILDASNTIFNVKMTDINTFIFSVITNNYIQYIQPGNTEIYNAYLPNVFNAVNSASILDICGNMAITGDLNINDTGKLKTNSTTFYLANTTANTIYFAGDASNIYIGKSTSDGKTYIRHQLDVSDNIILHKDIFIEGRERIYNKENAIDLSSGALQVYGGASIQSDVYLGGNAIIYKDISLNGNQSIHGNLTANNNLMVNAKTFAYGDVFIQKNANIIGDISLNQYVFVGKDVSINQNLYVQNNTFLNNLNVNTNTFLNNNLYIINDVSINGKVFINTDISVNGNITVGKDTTVNGNIYVSKNQTIIRNQSILGDISLNGNQIINGNLIINANEIINGNAYLNGNVTIGSNNTNLLNINASTNFVNDVSLNGNIYIVGTANLESNLDVFGDINTESNAMIQGNLNVYGSNITFGSYPTDTVIIQSQTNIDNNLYVASDISTNGNIFISDYNKSIYSQNLESLWYHLNPQDISSINNVLNVGINTNTLNIGTNARNLTIGNPNCTLQLFGASSANIVLSGPEIIINSSSTSANASNAGLYIEEGYYTADVSNLYHAAYVITSQDRNKFKFKVPNSNNIVALNIHDLTLNTNMNNGILVINRSTDTDISYNINVSSYDISNILVRDRNISTSTNQVINTNISVLGNMTVNQAINYSSNNAIDVSGNISQRNGWITQF